MHSLAGVGVGMVRGGSRYVEGCWGFPYVEMKKVAWFLGFLVSCVCCIFVPRFLGFFLRFLAAKFQVFNVSSYQK